MAEHVPITDKHEDIVTMGANVVLRLLEKIDGGPKRVTGLYGATESSFDNAKPFTTYIAGVVEQVYGRGSTKHWDAQENKFACVAGAQAINNAVHHVASQRLRREDDVVLFIASDEAKYKDFPERFTDGAGAIGGIVKRRPGVLEAEIPIGNCLVDEDDFFKPLDSGDPEWHTYPIVAGQRSTNVYLDGMRDCADDYEQWARQLGIIKSDQTLLDAMDLVAYHIPFKKQGVQAFAFGLLHCMRGTPKEKDLEAAGIGHIPNPEEFDSVKGYHDARKAFAKKFVESDFFKGPFEEKAAPCMMSSPFVGNSYTTKVIMSMQDGLSSGVKEGRDLAGGRVGQGSYGSGSLAKFQSWRISEDWEIIAKEFDVMGQLKGRRSLSRAEADALRKKEVSGSFVAPHSGEVIRAGLASNGRRLYAIA